MTRKKAEILSGKLSRSEKVHSDELGGRDLLTRIRQCTRTSSSLTTLSRR